MIGLILLFVAAAWLALVVAIAYAFTSRIKDVVLRVVVALVLVGVLLPLPVIDELVGKRQFEQLCIENSTIQLDRATAAGRTVYFVPQPSVEIKGTWVRVVLQPHRFVDSTTGAIVASYNTLIAEGGRLVRGLSEGGGPFTFQGSCLPRENPRDLFDSLNITAQDRPAGIQTKGE